MKLGHAAAAFLLALGWGAAEAADLEAVRAALTPLRQSTRDPATRMRPEFLIARDGLRDWIESRLAGFPQGGDTGAFSKALNLEIVAKDLSCVEAKSPGYNRCTSPGELDARGFIGAVDVSRVRDLLIVQAETGVPCGFDETAYVYEWVKDGWRRLFDTSQTSRARLYVAEQIQQMVFVRPDDMPVDSLLIAVTGVSPSCEDRYRPAHYRVWSAKRGHGASLVVDGREGDAYVSRRAPAISARFEGSDLLLELDVRSMDSSRTSRVAVRRFNFAGAEVRRVAPLALTPRDFVEDWLRAPWSTALEWTHAGARAALGEVHKDANAHIDAAKFSGPTRRCEKETSAVEVGVRFANGERFFRVRHDPLGAYLMLGADSTTAVACAVPDSALDAPRTLFPN